MTMSAAEFDHHDLVPVDPTPCVHCGIPSSTASLTFEAPLHRACVGAVWMAYWAAELERPEPFPPEV